MEEAEDISQIVIGIAGGKFFDELFAEGLNRPSDRFSDWFSAETAQFGGTDAVEAVRALVGNVARYDFQSAGMEIPKLDLPALGHFFRHAMQLNNRRVIRSDDGLSVVTPERWRESPDLRDRYDGLVFERSLPARAALAGSSLENLIRSQVMSAKGAATAKAAIAAQAKAAMEAKAATANGYDAMPVLSVACPSSSHWALADNPDRCL
jgi:hypothetical protein